MYTSIFFTTFLVAFSTAVSATSYTLKEDFFDGQGFFSHFDFYTGADPTHGLVNYVDQSTAQSNGLINTTTSSAWIGADSTKVLSGNTGRDSVRLSSKNSYTHMLVILQLEKLPVSCGSWPAFWTFGPDWPASGEIDILEGVNDQKSNQMTMHTSQGCSATGSGSGLLQPLNQDCEGNTGCGFSTVSDKSFSGANAVDGGVWAMEWTSNGISVWWWDPEDLGTSTVLTSNPDVSTFGQPQVNLPNGNDCNIDSHFKNHSIVFDWSFCGDWAGSAWDSSSCKTDQYPTCQSFVQNNPGAYSGVGWDVRYLKVFA